MSNAKILQLLFKKTETARPFLILKIQFTLLNVGHQLISGCRNKRTMQHQPHNTTGPDKIPAQFLKVIASELASVLTTMFQSSLLQGKLRDDWKQQM